MNSTYSKKEKLKGKKLIEHLFSEGNSVSSYPLRLIYKEVSFNDGSELKVGVSVSKRLFKRAVDRNHIKRLLRESIRLHKSEYFNNIATHYALMILYIGKDIPTFSDTETNVMRLFKTFLKTVYKD